MRLNRHSRISRFHTSGSWINKETADILQLLLQGELDLEDLDNMYTNIMLTVCLENLCIQVLTLSKKSYFH